MVCAFYFTMHMDRYGDTQLHTAIDMLTMFASISHLKENYTWFCRYYLITSKQILRGRGAPRVQLACRCSVCAYLVITCLKLMSLLPAPQIAAADLSKQACKKTKPTLYKSSADFSLGAKHNCTRTYYLHLLPRGQAQDRQRGQRTAIAPARLHQIAGKW